MMSMHQNNLPPLQDPAFKDLMELFNEQSYLKRLIQMFHGLAKPKDTRAYRLAHLELQRQWAPFAAIVIPAVSVALLMVLSSRSMQTERSFETEIIDPEEMPELEEIIEDEPLPDDIQPTDIQFTPDLAMQTPTPSAVDNAPMTPQVATFDTVMPIKSPVILRNVYGSTRGAGMRGQLVSEGGGNQATETAVMRALRWLKKNQQKDGSWLRHKDAMTALAIMCFLAHGEKPGESVEFGDTVQRGIEYLIGSQRPNGTWRGNYQPYIATYALCEAYGMTMNPNVREAAERGVAAIIKGQHATGGWDYALKLGDRDDTSVMGWAAQALKAAMMADFYSDKEALQRASKLSIKGFQRNAHPEGGFGYTGPGRGGLTSVGVLCMQFHGGAKLPECVKGLEYIDSWKPAWNGSTPENPLPKDAKQPKIPGVPGGSTQYYYYYATQAKFQDGGSRWKKWNEGMWPEYVKAQFVEKDAIEDPDGNLQDIGWWENSDNHSDRFVMDTSLAALQLMVYYRYLPTFKAVVVEEEVAVATDVEDIEVEINL